MACLVGVYVVRTFFIGSCVIGAVALSAVKAGVVGSSTAFFGMKVLGVVTFVIA